MRRRTTGAEGEGVTDFRTNFIRLVLDGVAKQLLLENRAAAPSDLGLPGGIAIIPIASPNTQWLRGGCATRNLRRENEVFVT